MLKLEAGAEDGLEFAGLSEGVGYSCRRDFGAFLVNFFHTLEENFDREIFQC